MRELMHIIAPLLIVLALVPALAHVLELPGKRRLDKDTYFAVQGIYYPGFTTAGVSEPLAALVALGMLFGMPRSDGDFWLILTAALALLAMQAVFWFITQPVNRFWVSGLNMGHTGSAFFATGTGNHAGQAVPWTTLRDRWEYSHVVRALLCLLAFGAMLASVLT